jgi:predicted secreted protein
MPILQAALAAGLIIATLLTAGCSATSTLATSKTAPDTSLSDAAALPTATTANAGAAQSVNAVVGQEITFALPSNPTTGYSWQSVYDNNTFSLVNDTYTPDAKADKNLVGSGGTQNITLKTLKSGQAAVTFNGYSRN